MSSLDTMITDSIYSTLVAEDATYIDGSGDEIDVLVVRGGDEDESIDGMNYNVRGAQIVFYIRKSSLSSRPVVGDLLVTDDGSFCLTDDARNYSVTEWQMFVRPD